MIKTNKKKNARRRMYLKMVSGSILRRRSRMIIALLAVAIGGTILYGLMTIYYDIPQQMGKAFRSYGANLIFVPGEGRSVISDKGIEIIKDTLKNKNVVGMAWFRYENVKINEQPIVAAGTQFENVKKTSPYWYITGEWPQDSSRVLVGKEVSERLNLVPGKNITIHGKTSTGEDFNKDFTVSGILQTGKSEESLIFVDLSVLEQLTKVSGNIHVVECSVVQSRDELQSFIDNFKQHHHDITARLVKRVTNSEKTVLAKLQTLVYLVSIIVLGLTMICVITTMMAAVLERRKEIGLKKALGASNRSIMRDFLGEAILLGIFGGILGIVLGFLFALQVGRSVFGYTVSVMPLLAVITISVSVVITAAAAIIPARRVSDVEPAVVLKGE